jgi:hypothetical protein
LKPLAPSPAWTLVTPYCKRTRPGHETNTKAARFPPLSRPSPATSLPPFALGLAPTHLGWGTRRHFTRRLRDPPVSKRRQYYLKERLEGMQFFTLAQLHQRALACESRSKETAKTMRHKVHIVECDQSSSDDESAEVYAAEMVWPKQAKSLACSSLQPVQKKRQEEVKCDKIFDELLKMAILK